MPALFVSLSFSPPCSPPSSLSLLLISLSIYTDLITRTFFKASSYKALEWKVHSLLFKLTSLLHSAWPNHRFSTWHLVHPMSCSVSLTKAGYDPYTSMHDQKQNVPKTVYAFAATVKEAISACRLERSMELQWFSQRPFTIHSSIHVAFWGLLPCKTLPIPSFLPKTPWLVDAGVCNNTFRNGAFLHGVMHHHRMNVTHCPVHGPVSLFK